ncbi:MAG: hypothetical protein F6K40_18950 [Okeania sp. SIO3I5]|uniref:hypothetical protein n=1 Tax=Okeania sp. SIO3I5 TaxID=2607805 RepID=UPI0013BDE5E8|nr:hypothetical protein [Okeania sp. SIO3I5]NEQ38226.1 hypothetical protein [Okeania sp. SIO3I5]
MVERVWEVWEVSEVWEVWEVGSCGKLVRVGRNYKTYVSSPFLSRTTNFIFFILLKRERILTLFFGKIC